MSIEDFIKTLESEGKSVLCNGMAGDVRVLVAEVREPKAPNYGHGEHRIEVWMGDAHGISGQVDIVDWHRRRAGATTVIATSWGDRIMLWRRMGQTPRDLYNGEAIV
jgi:hypothetical protein